MRMKWFKVSSKITELWTTLKACEYSLKCPNFFLYVICVYPLWDYKIKLIPELLPFQNPKKLAKHCDFGQFLSNGMVYGSTQSVGMRISRHVIPKRLVACLLDEAQAAFF